MAVNDAHLQSSNYLQVWNDIYRTTIPRELRNLFRTLWRSKHGSDWRDGESGSVFKDRQPRYKLNSWEWGVILRKYIDEWDVSVLCYALTSASYISQRLSDDQKRNIDQLRDGRNILAHDVGLLSAAEKTQICDELIDIFNAIGLDATDIENVKLIDLCASPTLQERDKYVNDLCALLSWRASMLQRLGRLKESIECCLSACDISATTNTLQYIDSLMNLGWLYCRVSKIPEALRVLHEADDLCKQTSTFPTGSIHQGYISMNLSYVYCLKGSLLEAEKYCLKAVYLFENKFGPESLKYAEARDCLGVVRYEQGQWTDAQSMHESAMHIWQSKGRYFHPKYSLFLKNAGHVARALQLFNDAEALYDEALRIMNSLDLVHLEDNDQQEENIEKVFVLCSRALLWLDMGKHSERAIRELSDAMDIVQKYMCLSSTAPSSSHGADLSGNSLLVADCSLWLGYGYLKTYHLQRAENYINNAILCYSMDQCLGTGSIKFANALTLRAKANLLVGNHESALQDIYQVVKIFNEHESFGPDSIKFGEVLLVQAEIHLHVDKYFASLCDVNHALQVFSLHDDVSTKSIRVGDALILRAEVNIQFCQFEDALLDISRLAEIYSQHESFGKRSVKYGEVLLLQVEVNLQVGNNKAALAGLNSVVHVFTCDKVGSEMGETFAYVLLLRAEVNIRLGYYDSASEDISQVVGIFVKHDAFLPGNIRCCDTLLRQSMEKLRLGDHESALQGIDLVIQVFSLYDNIGPRRAKFGDISLLQTGKAFQMNAYSIAQLDLNVLVQNFSQQDSFRPRSMTFSDGLLLQAEVNLQVGSYESALKSINKVVLIFSEPGDSPAKNLKLGDALVLRANVYANCGNYQVALADLHRVVRIFSIYSMPNLRSTRLIDALFLQAKVHLCNSNHAAALVDIEQVIQTCSSYCQSNFRWPKFCDALLLQVEVNLRYRNYKAALNHINQVASVCLESKAFKFASSKEESLKYLRAEIERKGGLADDSSASDMINRSHLLSQAQGHLEDGDLSAMFAKCEEIVETFQHLLTISASSRIYYRQAVELRINAVESLPTWFTIHPDMPDPVSKPLVPRRSYHDLEESVKGTSCSGYPSLDAGISYWMKGELEAAENCIKGAAELFKEHGIKYQHENWDNTVLEDRGEASTEDDLVEEIVDYFQTFVDGLELMMMIKTEDEHSEQTLMGDARMAFFRFSLMNNSLQYADACIRLAATTLESLCTSRYASETVGEKLQNIVWKLRNLVVPATQEAWSTLKKYLTDLHAGIVKVLSKVNSVWFALELNLSEAENYIQQAINALNANYWSAQNCLGLLYYKQEHLTRAREVFESSLQRYRVLCFLKSAGHVAHAQRRYEDAHRYYSDALHRLDCINNIGFEREALLLQYSKAVLLLQMGKSSERTVQELSEILLKVNFEFRDHCVLRVECCRWIVRGYLRMCNLTSAIIYANRLINLLSSDGKFGPKCVEVGEALFELAEIYKKAGSHEAALQSSRRAVQIFEKRFGCNHIKYREAIDFNNNLTDFAQPPPVEGSIRLCRYL